jgi:hypothetical protein
MKSKSVNEILSDLELLKLNTLCDLDMIHEILFEKISSLESEEIVRRIDLYRRVYNKYTIFNSLQLNNFDLES